MGTFLSKVYVKLQNKQDVKILMVGLDAAGKTTLLYKLNLGEVIRTIPTIGFNVDTVKYKNISITTWDVGNKYKKIKPFWRHYYQNTNAIIFVVDSNDRELINKAKDELNHLLNEDELKDAILLVFANKQDIAGAMTVSEVNEKLGLSNLRSRQWFIQGSCATTGDGLYDGFDWLTTTLAKKY